MVEIYIGALTVFIAISVITAIYVVLQRRMPGSRVGGLLLLVGAGWSLTYLYQLTAIFTDDIINNFIWKLSFSYTLPVLFLLYIIRFFEFKTPQWVSEGLFVVPIVFSVIQLMPGYRSLVFRELILYNQNLVAVKYTVFGLIPVLYIYVGAAVLFGYFLKTLLAKQNILKIRVLMFLIIETIFVFTYTVDLFNVLSLGREITPLIVNLMSVAVAMFSSERLYKSDVLPSVFETMMEDIGDIVIVTDNLDRVIFVNTVAREVTKAKNIGFLDHYIWDVFPSLAIESDEIVQKLAADNKTYHVQSSQLYDWQNQTRTKVYVLRDISDLMDYQYNLEELVEKKSTELMKTERMAAIGQTTLMVGHDLRNPLQVLTFLSHQLKKQAGSDESMMFVLEKIDSNVNYMDKIVSDLTMFAKNAEPETQRIKLIDLLESSLLKINVPDNVILDYDFDFGFEIQVDPFMIERVFNNLLLNAIQSMPDGGVIYIEAENLNGKIELRVTDSGAGIPEEISETLFTPLSTTKPKGVGMGLAVCKKIMNLHKGDIKVDTTVRDGASFVIEMPEISG